MHGTICRLRGGEEISTAIMIVEGSIGMLKMTFSEPRAVDIRVSDWATPKIQQAHEI
jgi:hypothetical protein